MSSYRSVSSAVLNRGRPDVTVGLEGMIVDLRIVVEIFARSTENLLMRAGAFRMPASAVVALLAAAGAAGQGGPAGARAAPFGFLAPWIQVSDAVRERVDRDGIVVQMLPGDGGQLAVFAAARLDAPPERLLTWTRAIAALKRSRHVIAIRKFSDPPALSDLEDLTLDEGDLEALRACVPGDCSLKLAAQEIDSLRAAAAGGGSGWREALQREFRSVLAARVSLYRERGLAALPPIVSRRTPIALADTFEAILERSPYLARVPAVAAWLASGPGAGREVESFFYWSKESFGAGKPVIGVTHVGLFPFERDVAGLRVLVAGRQIFASHYLNGSLGLTMVLRGPRDDSNYFVYLNRSQIDLLKGFFAPLRRSVLEGRLREETPLVIAALRKRLESLPEATR